MFEQGFPATALFVCLSIFTPGPNNITSAAMGVLHGYRNSLPYLAGISVGFFVFMLSGGLLAHSLLAAHPLIEPTLRLIGATYILYLAFGLLQASYDFDADKNPPLGFGRGLVLQAVNPNTVIFSLMLFSNFFSPAARRGGPLLLVALVLALLCFSSVTLWTLFGTFVKQALRVAHLRFAVNALLATLLVYAAFNLMFSY